MSRLFRILISVSFGYVITCLLFQKQFSNEMIIEVFGASILTAFF